jgi:triosephosphate isomerase (TIM)
MKSARKFLVGGNWKSNGTVESVKDLVFNVLNIAPINFSKVEVVVAPMAIHIPLVQSILRRDIFISAQNASITGPGAYTGEIAPEHLKDLGLSWTIIGHSERRSFYGDTDQIVAGKVKRSLGVGLNVIACVGENLKERESGVTSEVVTRQLDAIKNSVADWRHVAIAYEPVWAIGTGVSASPAQAQEVHNLIRHWLHKNVNELTSNVVRVIYGGSVTDANAKELISQQDIDGFLVGGASLKPNFINIIESCYGKN